MQSFLIEFEGHIRRFKAYSHLSCTHSNWKLWAHFVHQHNYAFSEYSIFTQIPHALISFHTFREIQKTNINWLIKFMINMKCN